MTQFPSPLDIPPIRSSINASNKQGVELNGTSLNAVPMTTNDAYDPRLVSNRQRAEYYMDADGNAFVVNVFGEIGYLPAGSAGQPMKTIARCRNYKSWRGAVDFGCQYEGANEGTMVAVKNGEKDNGGRARLMQYEMEWPRYAAGQTGMMGFFYGAFSKDKKVLGFQTDMDRCVIFKNGQCIYNGEFDGRRVPVEFNYSDNYGYYVHLGFGMDNDHCGMKRGSFVVPELDDRGKIIWDDVCEEDGPLVYRYIKPGETVPDNGEGAASPIPRLAEHRRHHFAIWRRWYLDSWQCATTGAMVGEHWKRAAYTGYDFEQWNSWILERKNLCRVQATGIGDPKGWLGLGGDGSPFAAVPDLTTAIWSMKKQECGLPDTDDGSKEVPMTECRDPDNPIPRCKHLTEESFYPTAVCTFFDFDRSGGFNDINRQMQGYAHSKTITANSNDSHIEVIKRQPIFRTSTTHRRLLNLPPNTNPQPMPEDWSLLNELGISDTEAPLSAEWYTGLDKTDGNNSSTINFPKWWQKYTETFYMYQSKYLSCVAVRSWSGDSKANDYGPPKLDGSPQYIHEHIDLMDLQIHVPSWMRLVEYKVNVKPDAFGLAPSIPLPKWTFRMCGKWYRLLFDNQRIASALSSGLKESDQYDVPDGYTDPRSKYLWGYYGAPGSVWRFGDNSKPPMPSVIS